jgi:hypothetical protein
MGVCSSRRSTPTTNDPVHPCFHTSTNRQACRLRHDDENIPTADIITHVIEGKHPPHYLERDGQLVTVVTEAEREDNLPDNELEEAGSTSNSESGSGSDFEEPDDDKPSSLFPTVTQGRSVRVRKPRDLSYLNRFWDD